MIVCGLLKVRASTHWLGMGQSVHRYFLMASYLSFRELDKIQTTFGGKRIFVRSCILRAIQHLNSSLGKSSYVQEKHSNVHNERKNCRVSVSALQNQRLFSRRIPMVSVRFAQEDEQVCSGFSGARSCCSERKSH